MTWYLWGIICGLIYAGGFFATLAFNMALGTVMVELAFARACVWPYYWITGRPAGQRYPMD